MQNNISFLKGERLASFEHINKMAAETMLMLNKSIETYIERDVAKAAEVIKHDDIVDELFSEAKADIIKLILEKPSDGEYSCLAEPSVRKLQSQCSG